MVMKMEVIVPLQSTGEQAAQHYITTLELNMLEPSGTRAACRCSSIFHCDALPSISLHVHLRYRSLHPHGRFTTPVSAPPNILAGVYFCSDRLLHLLVTPIMQFYYFSIIFCFISFLQE